jgi:thiol-disulfide isomerase/thioredoxin
MKRNKYKNYFFAGVFLLFLICPGNTMAQGSLDYSLNNVLDGKTYKFADYKANLIVMVFGSMHCKPCVELIPVLNKIYDENIKSSETLVLGIDIDTSSNLDEIKKFAREKGIRFPLFIDTKNIARQNKVFVLPTILFIDGNGKEVKRYMGYQSYKVLEKEIRARGCTTLKR